MNVEDRISSSLRGTLSTLDGAPGDLEAVRRSGDRLRARRRVLAGGAAAVVVALVATGAVALRGDEPSEIQPAPPGGTWEQVPDLPLAPRAAPALAWTGSEVLVVGGYLTVCPPAADCAEPGRLAVDGAAYDPATGTWREIADAPVGLADYFRTTMVGDQLVAFDGDHGDWYAYDVGDDKWRDLPAPRQGAIDMGSLGSAADGFVYTLSKGGSVLALNLETEHWAQVPIGAPGGVESRTVVVTDPLGFVVSGAPVEGEGTIVAGVHDSTPRTVETGQLNPFRHWTGERLVELDLQVRENDDGSTTPYGGRLDPATGEWSPLPNQPEDSAGDGWSPVAADGPLMAGWGYVYDDRDGSWTRLGRPGKAVAQHGTSAVWADDRLVVIGGADESSDPTDQGWIWAP
jgi:hypothetical protein